MTHLYKTDRYLPTIKHASLLNWAQLHRDAFTDATTATGAENYRQSFVCFEFPFRQMMYDRFFQEIDRVMAFFEEPVPSSRTLEVQLNAHSDGHFYKPHDDSGSTDTASRLLSGVYYFFEPGFSGGQLRLYEAVWGDLLTSFEDYQPVDNSCVFFPSDLVHEVLPVIGSTDWRRSRFSVTYWLRTPKYHAELS